jgi:N6-L-threonylcarbamoyladenine synthase
MLIVMEDHLRYRVLGSTLDDAAGEAFDKVAKILGLGYPGGPKIDRLAESGNPNFRSFPSPRLPNKDHKKSYAFSFSGIKTNVLYFLRDLGETERIQMLDDHLPDIAASFQKTVVDALVSAIGDAVEETGVESVAIVGGVSANRGLRTAAQAAADKDGFALFVPDFEHSVDNAAMIAVTGAFKLAAGQTSELSLTAEPALKL